MSPALPSRAPSGQCIGDGLADHLQGGLINRLEAPDDLRLKFGSGRARPGEFVPPSVVEPLRLGPCGSLPVGDAVANRIGPLLAVHRPCPIPGASRSHRGKARSSRSLATADTECLRWRASNYSRSWTSSVNRRLRGLVFPAGAGRFRRTLGGGACNSPAGSSRSSVSTSSGGTSAGGSAGAVGQSSSIEAAPNPVVLAIVSGGDGAKRRVLSHRASTGVKHDAGGRRYLVRAAARRTVRQPGPGAPACPPPASPCSTRRGGSARPRPATTWPGRSPTWAVASCWWTTTRSPA